MGNTEQFGDRLKAIRKALSLSQIDFAKGLEIGRSTIANYESNQRIPPKLLLKQIAETYNINLDYLLYGIEPILQSDKIKNIKVNSNKIEYLNELCNMYHLDDESKDILNKYLTLTPTQRQLVNDFLKLISNTNI